jgi:flagellar basal-body rod protein FlgC
MGMFDAINAAATGLSAQRLRMDIISQNIANAETTRTENGGPYRRKVVVFQESDNRPFSDYLSSESKELINSETPGVKVTKIAEDTSDFKKVYDPTHPDADKDGYVTMPNVDVLTEMVNMISATRSYEANVTAINSAKSMAMKALEIGNK